jgi:hypothetical protein
MHYVRMFAERMNKNIVEVPEGVVEVMREHSWPGNIRELQNFIERSVILSPGHSLRAPLKDPKQRPVPVTGIPVTLEDAQRAHICNTLDQTKWVVGGPGSSGPTGDQAIHTLFPNAKTGHFSQESGLRLRFASVFTILISRLAGKPFRRAQRSTWLGSRSRSRRRSPRRPQGVRDCAGAVG